MKSLDKMVAALTLATAAALPTAVEAQTKPIVEKNVATQTIKNHENLQAIADEAPGDSQVFSADDFLRFLNALPADQQRAAMPFIASRALPYITSSFDKIVDEGEALDASQFKAMQELFADEPVTLEIIKKMTQANSLSENEKTILKANFGERCAQLAGFKKGEISTEEFVKTMLLLTLGIVASISAFVWVLDNAYFPSGQSQEDEEE